MNRDNKLGSKMLYELLVYSEWKHEPEYQKSHRQNFRGTSTFPPKLLLDYFSKTSWPPQDISRITSRLLPWHICLSEDGKFVAVLQEGCLEIRTSRDDFTSIIGRASVPKENSLQWRQMVWSPDCSMIAIALSNGNVTVYDLLGSHLFTIPAAIDQPSFSEVFIAGLIFLKSRTKNPKWSHELLVIHYNGILNCYYASPTDGYLEAHSIVLNQSGVSNAAWHHRYNLLFVAEQPSGDPYIDKYGWSAGLVSWRLLNDYPYYKKVVSYDDSSKHSTNILFKNWWNRIKPISIVFKMKVSPMGNYLACIHTCGTISLWHLPSLRLHKEWPLNEQKKYFLSIKEEFDVSSDHQPIDIDWRADEKLIISRFDGITTVYDVSLELSEGSGPEFLSGHPRLSSAPDHSGFLALECEEVFLAGSPPTSPQELGSDNDNSFLNASSEIIQSTIYMITDIEKYQPRKRSKRVIQKTYKLLGVKSTTPEELFNRKLDNGNFEEALTLAQKYNLDCDRVYQRQWRNSPVLIETINNYLSKINKQEWVLDECIVRIPETFYGAKDLIDFAMNYTSIEKFLQGYDSYDNGFPEILLNEVGNLDKNKLTALQIKILSTRLKLLEHSDKLKTYELILGGGEIAEEKYDMYQYGKFLHQHVVESAVEFARVGNVEAVQLILSLHTDETEPYLLYILENFPEILNPTDYSALLPECDGDNNVVHWNSMPKRLPDWSENPSLRLLVTENASQDSPKNIGNPCPLNVETLHYFYYNRISAIEQKSCILDNAIELLNIAKKNNIKGFDLLNDELLTLEALIYHLQIDDIDLSSMRKMPLSNITSLLMSKSSENTFVDDILKFLIPYLNRCENYNPGTKTRLLKEYLGSVSSVDLTLPLKFFVYLIDENMKAVGNVNNIIQFLIHCIYCYENCDQLSLSQNVIGKAKSWLEHLAHDDCQKKLLALLKEIELELISSEILLGYGIKKSVIYLHNQKANMDIMKQLLILLTHVKPRSENIYCFWENVLKDINVLQKGIFNCLPINECYEIYASALLACGSSDIIKTAGRILCTSSQEEDLKYITFKRSTELIIEASIVYYKSAQSFNDYSMQLAKTCLLLVKEDSKDIQDELDLISSLRYLSEFGLDLLPIQVRLMTDRSQLIVSCLKNNVHAYLDPSLLYKLSDKLRVFGNDMKLRNSFVTISLAEAALLENDFTSCAEFCNSLIQKEDPRGWNICFKLAQVVDFYDNNVKLKLFAFSAIHAPAKVLPSILKSKNTLVKEMYESNVANTILNADKASDQMGGAKLRTEFQGNIFDPTNLIKIVVILPHFWNDVFLPRSLKLDTLQKDNNDFCKFGCNYFYASLFDEPHISNLNVLYGTHSPTPSKLEINSKLMMLSSLEESSNEYFGIIDKAKINSSQLLMTEDTTLALGFLLSLNDYTLSEECFSSLPQSPLRYKIAIYYYSLLCCVHTSLNVLYYSPQKLLNIALKNTGAQEIVNLIKKHQIGLQDLRQVQRMEKLDCGVNIVRFSSDDDYKKDSIFGLAMAEDYGKLKLALDLSARNNISSSEVIMYHLKYLFLNQQYSLIMDRLNDELIVNELQLSSQFFVQRLIDDVLPHLSGYDHQGFVVFFTIMKLLAENTSLFGLVPKEHIRLLKKVKLTSSDIDYNELAIKKSPLYNVLKSAVNQENILNISRLIKSLPEIISNNFSPSKLYLYWTMDQFSKSCLDDKLSPKQQVHNFEPLFSYIGKLTAEDFKTFISETLLSHTFTENISSTSRKHLINSLIQWCVQQQNKSKEWANEILILEENNELINKVWDDDLDFLITGPLKQKLIAIEINLRNTNHNGLTEVLHESLLDPFLDQNEVNIIYNASGIKENLYYIILDSFQYAKDVKRLHLLMGRMESSLQNENLNHSWPDMISHLSKLNIPPEFKHLVTGFMQKFYNKYHKSNVTAVTQTLLDGKWSLEDIQDSDFSNENNRVALFYKLLENSETLEQIIALQHILVQWSPFSKQDQCLEADLIQTLIHINDENKYNVLQLIMENCSIEEKELNHLVKENENSGEDLFLSLICFMSGLPSFRAKGRALLEKSSDSDYTPELLKILVSEKIFPFLIDSSVYENLVTNILPLAEDKTVVSDATATLIKADMLPEAVHLTFNYLSIPSSLQVFNMALDVKKLN